MLYGRKVMEKLAKDLKINMHDLSLQLGFERSYIGNMARCQKVTPKCLAVLEELFADDFAYVADFLAQDEHWATKEAHAAKRFSPGKKPAPAVIRTFVDFEKFVDFLADNCGLVWDVHAKTKIFLANDPATVLQEFEMIFTLACETNAYQSYMRELCEGYEEAGHDFDILIEVTSMCWEEETIFKA